MNDQNNKLFGKTIFDMNDEEFESNLEQMNEEMRKNRNSNKESFIENLPNDRVRWHPYSDDLELVARTGKCVGICTLDTWSAFSNVIRVFFDVTGLQYNIHDVFGETDFHIKTKSVKVITDENKKLIELERQKYDDEMIKLRFTANKINEQCYAVCKLITDSIVGENNNTISLKNTIVDFEKPTFTIDEKYYINKESVYIVVICNRKSKLHDHLVKRGLRNIAMKTWTYDQ